MMGIGVLYSGSMVYGFNTIEAIFGEEETRNLLRQAPQIPQLAEAAAPVLPRFGQIALERLSKVIALLSPFVPKASKNGLFWIAPMIAPALLLSRTSLADGVFNALPIPVSSYSRSLYQIFTNINRSTSSTTTSSPPTPSP